jgi:predicted transposase YbfD/YdcC
MAAPLLDTIDIKGKDITADALLTQRDFANYLVSLRHAHYHFTVKKNQRTLREDIKFYFLDVIRRVLSKLRTEIFAQ